MRKIFLTALAGVLAGAAALTAGFGQNEKSPHAFTQNDCFFCHFTLPGEGESDTEPLRFTDAISKLCARCHDMSRSISHKVDFVPPEGAVIPKDMPLDESGRITCATCHDVHKPYINPLTGERTYFLRREPAGRSFCLACHVTNESLEQIRLASAGSASLGDVVSMISHRPAMDKVHGFARFEVLDMGSRLDPLSLACLDCHDEPGSPQKTSLGPGIWRHAPDGIGLSHPIGVDYHSATVQYEDLVQERDLDPRIKLFDGKLGCCTCHDMYAPVDGQGLVIGTRESFQDLCFACHIK